MFKQVVFNECDVQKDVEEAEVHGYMDKGTQIISLASMLKWMEKVNASQNAKYLKCLNGSTKKGVMVESITDIVFDANLVAIGAPTTTNVKMAFVSESPNAPAMTVATAYDLFTKIAALCAEKGIDTAKVGVYLQNEAGRLTRFSWYYNDESDTAVVVKNMGWQDAAKFLQGAEVVLDRAARTPQTADKIIDELVAIEKQMNALKDKQAKAFAKLDALPQMGESEDVEDGEEKDSEEA